MTMPGSAGHCPAMTRSASLAGALPSVVKGVPPVQQSR